MDYPKLKCERFNSTSILLSIEGGPHFDSPSMSEQWTGIVSEDGILTIPDEVWERLGWEVDMTVEWVDCEDGTFLLVKVDEEADSGDESPDDGDDGA